MPAPPRPKVTAPSPPHVPNDPPLLNVPTIVVDKLGEQEAHEQLEYLKKLCADGACSVLDLRQYAYLAKKYQHPYNHIVNLYLSRQTNLLSDENVRFIFDFATTADNQAIEVVLNNLLFFKARYRNANQRLTDAFRQSVTTITTNRDFMAFEKLRKDIVRAKLPNGNNLLFEIETTYYQGVGDWKRHFALCQQYIAANHVSNHVLLNKLAAAYAESVQDKKMLQAALEWAMEAERISPVYENLYQVANLLYKLQVMEKAEKKLDQSIKVGQKAGADVQLALELLEKLKGEE